MPRLTNDQQRLREVRDALAENLEQLRELARVRGLRMVCGAAWEALGDIVCDIDSWMGWGEDA